MEWMLSCKSVHAFIVVIIYFAKIGEWHNRSIAVVCPTECALSEPKSSKGLSILYCSVNVWNIIDVFVILNTHLVRSERIDVLYAIWRRRRWWWWWWWRCRVPTTMRECSSYFVVVYQLYIASSYMVLRCYRKMIVRFDYIFAFVPRLTYCMLCRYSTNHDWNDKWMSCINLFLSFFSSFRLHFFFSSFAVVVARCSLWLNLYLYWANVCMMNHTFYIWKRRKREEKKIIHTT